MMLHLNEREVKLAVIEYMEKHYNDFFGLTEDDMSIAFREKDSGEDPEILFDGIDIILPERKD